MDHIVKRLRIANITLGVSLVLVLNIAGALPRLYKGVQHRVGREDVSVYVTEGESNEIPVPVQQITLQGFSDTGQQVQVYLRNAYKDDIITHYPRCTLLIVAATGLIHLLLTRMVARYRPAPRE